MSSDTILPREQRDKLLDFPRVISDPMPSIVGQLRVGVKAPIRMRPVKLRHYLDTIGAELVGEVAQYENRCRLCYMRGPAGIIVALAEELF
jgi:hypothetical protein